MNDIDLAAYVFGKRVSTLSHPFKSNDCIFGSAQLDGQKIKEGYFERCTFTNVSFKKTDLGNTRFQHCVFIGCYFRRAELVDCGFVGCRFIDCNFNHIALKSCDFRYASFSGCQLPFNELQHCLPSEPNLREDLARNLYLESGRLGLAAEARRYRMTEIHARESNLKAAVLAQSRWYREHYDPAARAVALGELILSLLNRRLWGYGQRSWVLVLNLAIAAFGLFPAIFYLLREGLLKTAQQPVTVSDLFYFSLQNILPAGIQSGIEAVSLGTRIAAGTEAIFGIVALALFASYIYRWSLHR
jgi:hypothetical protein